MTRRQRRGDVSTSQGTWRTCSKPLSAKSGLVHFPITASEGTGPADILVLAFQPPEMLKESISVVYATQFVAHCYSC